MKKSRIRPPGLCFLNKFGLFSGRDGKNGCIDKPQGIRYNYTYP